jgi:hypothetical protein
VAMPEQHETVVSIVDYLEATLRKMDEFVSEIQAWAEARQEIALRLAVLRAAADPAVHDAASDYEQRVAEGRPYEAARPADDVIRDAHARYGTP